MVTRGPSPVSPVSPADKTAIEDLAIANRILASSQLEILDAYGHVSVRSTSNPNHYFISRYVSAGVVVPGDIIENDLDSVPVNGPRDDQYQERFIHGEVYKARPDVMAVVHAHTPELVAFGVSSVPLHTADAAPFPLWDIRKFNDGNSGIITNPALAKSMAESLGKSNMLLLFGHGVVIVDTSLYRLVNRANGLRRGAQVQMQTIALGGQPNYLDMPRGAEPAAAAQKTPNAPRGTGGTEGVERSWEYWKKEAQSAMKSQANAPKPASAASPRDRAIDDLVLANHMLASTELGILDSMGHVSVRDPDNPSHYFISRYVSPGSVTASDIIENDFDSKSVSGNRTDEYQERYIHGEIYRVRPDVMAVVYAHTPELVAFGQSTVTLRPVVNSGTLIRDGLPIFDIRKFNDGGQERIVSSAQLGKSLAGALGMRPAVLLQGQGVVVVANSLYNLVGRAYGLRINAKIQQEAIALGGKITYLDPLPGAKSPRASPGQSVPTKAPFGSGGGTAGDRAWEYWRQIVTVK